MKQEFLVSVETNESDFPSFDEREGVGIKHRFLTEKHGFFFVFFLFSESKVTEFDSGDDIVMCKMVFWILFTNKK